MIQFSPFCSLWALKRCEMLKFKEEQISPNCYCCDMALVYNFNQIGGPNFETNLWIRFRLFTHFGLCKCVIVFDSNSTDLYNCKMYVMSYNNYIIETITKCILFT